MAVSAQSEESLRLTRTFPAPREKVFRAWTDPKALGRWFAPTPAFETRTPIFELRVGGRHEIEMELEGVYREIRSPERLAFTWQWLTGPSASAPRTMLVTLDFVERRGATEIVLTHEGFSGAADRDQHDHGWKDCLDSLERRSGSSSRSWT